MEKPFLLAGRGLFFHIYFLLFNTLQKLGDSDCRHRRLSYTATLRVVIEITPNFERQSNLILFFSSATAIDNYLLR